MIIRKIALLASTILLMSSELALADSKNKWKVDLDDDSGFVTSVSKVPEDPFEAAAAIYVITRKDIERSGATSIAEVLRQVPGLQVARASANQWAITSRGFNSIFSNKLLVLVDGRTVYSPLFSGVYWQVQDTIMEDIKQIEVIRGPGATQWGANAVNGVINIITEPSVNTQGGLLSTTYGTEDKGHVQARYGGEFGESSHYRVYAKYFERDDLRTLNDTPANDEWKFGRAGFKIDYEDREKDSITFQGDIYDGGTDLDFILPNNPTKTDFQDFLDIYGGNLMTKWKHYFDDGGETKLQLYYDLAARDYELLDQEAQTFDVDFQYSKTFADIHNVVTGFGYRFVDSHLDGSTFRINFNPVNRNTQLFSAFIQDKIEIAPDKFFLTLGSKFEHNDFTGFEVQPSARVSWLPTDNQTVWASVSRAVRTPNIAEDDIKLVTDSTGAIFIRQQGDRGFNSEELIAYEAGYRVKPTKDTLIDTTFFFNDYDNLRSVELLPITVEPEGAFLPAFPENNGTGKAYGIEVSSSWQATKKWELKANYSYLHLDLDALPGSADTQLEKEEERSPRHQFSIHSLLELPYGIEFDNSLYFVDNIVVSDHNSQTLKIPSYIRFDTHIGWKYSEKLSFDLVGQNLFNDLHPEFSGQLWSEPSQIGRTLYGKVTYKF